MPHYVARELAIPNFLMMSRVLAPRSLGARRRLRVPGGPPKPLEVLHAHRVAVVLHDKAIVGEPAGHVDEDSRGEGVEAVSDEPLDRLLGRSVEVAGEVVEDRVVDLRDHVLHRGAADVRRLGERRRRSRWTAGQPPCLGVSVVVSGASVGAPSTFPPGVRSHVTARPRTAAGHCRAPARVLATLWMNIPRRLGGDGNPRGSVEGLMGRTRSPALALYVHHPKRRRGVGPSRASGLWVSAIVAKIATGRGMPIDRRGMLISPSRRFGEQLLNGCILWHSFCPSDPPRSPVGSSLTGGIELLSGSQHALHTHLARP